MLKYLRFFNDFFLYYRFRIDQNYVGDPPQLEVAISNLNDNIDRAFLSDMMSKLGAYEELNIFYHPVTNKHLGFSRIVFEEVKAAKMCVEKFHGKSVMGKVSLQYFFHFERCCGCFLSGSSLNIFIVSYLTVSIIVCLIGLFNSVYLTLNKYLFCNF